MTQVGTDGAAYLNTSGSPSERPGLLLLSLQFLALSEGAAEGGRGGRARTLPDLLACSVPSGSVSAKKKKAVKITTKRRSEKEILAVLERSCQTGCCTVKYVENKQQGQ